MENRTMEAVVISSFGNPEVLQIEHRPIPAPQGNEVLVKVYAAGINRPDVIQRKGLYPAPPDAPQDIPGMEIAGIIEACGPSVTKWKVGDAVCALIQGGGYAQYAIAQSGQCLPVPDGFSFAEAASLPETVFTVWHNVFRLGKLKKEDHFLVHGGSSGIGITAIQLVKAFGSTVFATAGTDEKCNACETLGATRCINYKSQDFEKELKSEGIDVILDMVGGSYIAKKIRLLHEEGRLVFITGRHHHAVFINTMKGSKPYPDDLPDFGLVMRKRLTISGSTLRNRDTAFKEALTEEILVNAWPKIESEAFKPVIFAEFPLESAHLAHQLMESSAHIGKIVLTNTW